jgi:hypothetical protein
MKRGINNIVDIKRGNTNITKVYRGDIQVWPETEIDIVFLFWNTENNDSYLSKWNITNNTLEWTISGIQCGTGLGLVYNSKYDQLVVGHNTESNLTRRGWSTYSSIDGNLVLLGPFGPEGNNQGFPHSGSCSLDGETVTVGRNRGLRVYTPSNNVYSGDFWTTNTRINGISTNNNFIYLQSSISTNINRRDYPSNTNSVIAGSITTNADGKRYVNGFYKNHWFYKQESGSTLIIATENSTKNGLITANNLNVGASIINYDVDKDGNIYVYHSSLSGNFISKWNSSRSLQWRRGSSYPGDITIGGSFRFLTFGLINNETQLICGIFANNNLRFIVLDIDGNYIKDITFPDQLMNSHSESLVLNNNHII